MMERVVQQADIVCFLENYEYGVQKMEIAAENGIERSATSMRTLASGIDIAGDGNEVISDRNNNSINGERGRE